MSIQARSRSPPFATLRPANFMTTLPTTTSSSFAGNSPTHAAGANFSATHSPKFGSPTLAQKKSAGLQATRFLLPAKSENSPKYTIVFDLDETLVNNRRVGKALIRPGTAELLQSLAGKAEIVLWTASIESVARPALKQLDPADNIFNHHIFRDRRWYKETGYTKDLRLLGRDMGTVVIVENSPMSVKLNRSHAIMVRDFISNMHDDSLATVKDVLVGLIDSDQSVPDFLGSCAKLTKNHEVLPSQMKSIAGLFTSPAAGSAVHAIRSSALPAASRISSLRFRGRL